MAALSVSAWAEQTWTVNFKDTDIQEVIKFVADVTGKTTVIDQRVKGRVKVISAKPLNQTELLNLFRTVLEINDFTLIEVENVLRIVPLKDARSSPVPVTDLAHREDGFVTQVIQLQNIEAAKVLPVIRPLVPQHSHLAAYDPSNAIVISDSIENIERMRKLIELIDRSATPITDIVPLKYASADDMVQTLSKLDQDEQKRGSQSKITLIADKRNNAVLITGEEVQRQRIKLLLTKLDQPKAQTGNVRVIYLEYAKAKPTAEVLTKVVANLSKLGPGGPAGEGAGAATTSATVEADEETNALLITAEGDTLSTLMDVVARLDIRRAQVLVEAIIVELQDGANLDLGVNWMFRNSQNGIYGASEGGGAGLAGAAFAGAVEGTNDVDALTALATALGSTTGQVLGVVGTNNDVDFSTILKAMEKDTKTNILSTPTLLTLDNSEASFTVGQNVPFVTGSFTNTGTGTNSPFQTIQREDVGITLKVKPQINEGDKVILDISQEISSISPSANGAADIITNQRKLDTQVLTTNGEIIVMGGFIKEESSMTESRVPILGSIPVLGRLFRSDTNAKAKTNLMIFLRTTVIRDDEALTGATAEKYQYIRQQQLDMRDRGFMRAKDKSAPLIPDMSVYDLSVPVDSATK
ncbi:MAG: type II secretion system secretin GspD [Marinagarivorans sp.]|nr:type II secretion system secretin GspD [Marinagarivorans sp.]